jgi:hypothetical protein
LDWQRVRGSRSGPRRAGALLLLAGLIGLGVVRAGADPAPAPEGPAPAPALADPKSAAAQTRPDPGSGTAESICMLVESAANANGLPPEFFVRLIFQESSFRPEAVGPVTRNGQRAEGIAQFMPGTAAERGLLDPFDPVEALPKSAEFLAELRGRFGNLGLAAAAYNAGPQRVQNWLDGRGGLPAETRNYVYAITGLDVDDWRPEAASAAQSEARKQAAAQPFSCAQVALLIRRSPNPYIGALEQRVAASAMMPWGVLLGAGFSRAKVLASYGRIERQHRALLAGRDPVILRMLLRSRGTKAFFQIRAGAESRQAAEALCTRLRAQGGACAVLRNSARLRRG